MSMVTGQFGELLYSSIATGTQLNTFTTEDNLMKTLPYCKLPVSLWQNHGATGRLIKLKASGRLGTTGTPTFTFNIRMLTTSTWSAAGIGIASAAITAGSGVTLAPWYLEATILLRTLATGAASTVAMMGDVRAGTAFAAGGGVYSLPAANTAFTSTSFDASIDQWLFLSAACGTSNASNLIQLEMMEVFGW